jgi:DNA helicase-2/ATP-dependent DNA helicase PcrA
MEQDHLDSLNLEQRRAVEHGSARVNEAPPLLIIAGAGSGKTKTLAHRVAHLIDCGADPSRILLLTFSRRAAEEMKRRVESIVKCAVGASGRLGWAGTFHAIGARLLRHYAENISINPAFNILDRDDAADLMLYVRDTLDLPTHEIRFPNKNACLSIYSKTVNTQVPLLDVLEISFPWAQMWHGTLKQLFGAYAAAKQQQGLLDFDDLLLYWSQMMLAPEIAADVSARFDFVLVDEYQDTNTLQASILLNLKPKGQGLTVVGDDAQSIYSFRAATVRNILDFPYHFQPAADIITLERNYRSTQPVLAACNAVIDLARERYAKQLYSERPSGHKPQIVTVSDEMEEARYVAEMVLENRDAGIDLKEQAVLFRAGHHSAKLELELSRRKIPFRKFGGLKFLDTAHVKDVMAALRWALNPKDGVAGLRLMLLLPGIGTKTAGKVLRQINEGRDLVEALERFRPPAQAALHWPDLVALMHHLRSSLDEWPAAFDRVLKWYEPSLDAYEDTRARKADLEQLQQVASTFETAERFLTELVLDPASAASDEPADPHLDDEFLTLSTVHSAKGLEWLAVFVLRATDGAFPADLGVGSEDEIEEERRLLYVAMTRAKDQLHLTLPRHFYVGVQRSSGDRHITAARTRFIPEEILGHFDQIAWPKRQGQITQGEFHVREDIGARVVNLWR